jgi:hypothetical protein
VICQHILIELGKVLGSFVVTFDEAESLSVGEVSAVRSIREQLGNFENIVEWQNAGESENESQHFS